jgi:outer membrane cobalamin receptor
VKRSLNLILVFSFFLITVSVTRAEIDSQTGPVKEETLLMFVGEDLEVLSLATRREESAWQAPAIAHVITRKQIVEQGLTTLSEALATVPGFHMAEKEWGTTPYMHGVPNSVLFLYDTVPLGSDVTKQLNSLDHELSLASVKRIEIVSGPGSVLWGPDAFAGIVNVVPMTAKDLDRGEAGVLYGSPGGQKGFYTNLGVNSGFWDVFASISGRQGEEDDTDANLVRFWQDEKTPVAFPDRLGDKDPGDSHYLEASGRISYGDWLSLSGRISDNKTAYALTGEDEQFTWCENKNVTSGHVKLEARKKLNFSSAIRVTGSYSWLNPEYEIIDRTISQEEYTSYGEILYDRSFLAGQSLFTAGASYRKKRIKGAPIWDGYLYDFLGPENELFVPLLTQKDYNTRLWSLFGQYTHKIGEFDFIAGVRQDDHDTYEDNISYNLGVVWSPQPQWVFKVLYGTAYRTPFSRQLREDEEPELEEIKNLSARISWKPKKWIEMSLTGFTSRIEDHVMEDPYAGLSVPNRQDIDGVEFELHFAPLDSLDVSANLTLLDNSGPDETYKYNDFSYIDEDGNLIRHYVDLFYPYDSGPDTLFNLTGTWQPTRRLTATARLRYFSSTELIHPRGETVTSFPEVWLVDLNAGVRDVLSSGLDLDVVIKNLFDRDYDVPGSYSAIPGESFTLEVILRKRW